jgi:hypothetical protein
MGTVYERRIAEQSEIERKIVRGNAQICARGNFGKAWKGLFPFKAADELAFRAGMSKRAADYQLSGEHAPSGRAIATLIALCVE